MKIIFVDDSTIVLETLKSLVLEMIETQMIECEFLSNPVKVKKMIKKETLEYDLMFVDINMPEVTGYDLARCAKKRVKYRYKPIIAITSEFTQEAKDIGKESGIDGWFIKSITQDSLQSSISDAIKQLYR
ncbi:MAG: response regulator [Campylobacterota bacterium]|nr:response regulator [Campylobacterota bacterium]